MFPFFVVLIIVLILVMAVWVWFTVTNYSQAQSVNCKYVNDDDRINNCSHLADSSVVFRILTAIIFLSLAVLQALYAIKLYYLDSQQWMRFLISSPYWIGVLNAILCISFASRGLYELFAIFNIFELPDIPLLATQDLSISDFVCFEMWYIVPTVLLITTLTGKSLGQTDSTAVSYFEISYGNESNGFHEKEIEGAIRYGSTMRPLDVEEGSIRGEKISLYGLNR